MEEKKEQLLEHLRDLKMNPNMKKIADFALAIRQLVLLVVAFCGMIAGFIQVEKRFGGEQFFSILRIVFIIVLVADFAFILKLIIQLVYGMQLSKMNQGSFSNEEYEALLATEKKLRKSSLICDLLTESVRSIIAFVLGVGFIVFGIYFAITGNNGAMEKVMIAILFPLMGILALVVFCSPIIANIKELRQIDHVAWEEYDEMKLAKEQKKRFKIADVKLFLFGLVFFLCGFFSMLQGFSFLAEHDIGQMVGMSVMGLIFMGAGGAVAYLLGIKGKHLNNK